MATDAETWYEVTIELDGRFGYETGPYKTMDEAVDYYTRVADGLIQPEVPGHVTGCKIERVTHEVVVHV